MKSKDILVILLSYICLTAIIAYFFFDSFIAFLVLIPLFPLYFMRQIHIKKRAYLEELEGQFCEMIGSISTALSAGISVENAFHKAKDDMEKLYGKESAIVININEILRELSINIPISKSLNNFSNRTNSEDIRDFVTVFLEALGSGGNLVEIIKNTVYMMQDKRRIEEEINAMLKGKMLEQKVICVIPFLIFAYLRISSKDFISVLYHNVTGVFVMIICLIIYIASILFSERIVNIRV